MSKQSSHNFTTVQSGCYNSPVTVLQQSSEDVTTVQSGCQNSPVTILQQSSQDVTTVQSRCYNSPVRMLQQSHECAGLTEGEKEEKARAKEALHSDGEGSDDEGDTRKAATYGNKKNEVWCYCSCLSALASQVDLAVFWNAM